MLLQEKIKDSLPIFSCIGKKYNSEGETDRQFTADKAGIASFSRRQKNCSAETESAKF